MKDASRKGGDEGMGIVKKGEDAKAQETEQK
jgi:hypothetical protein